MKEEITDQDITIKDGDVFYKIPYFVLEDEPEVMSLVRESFPDADGGDSIRVWIKYNKLESIKEIILAHIDEYRSFKYVKLNQNDRR